MEFPGRHACSFVDFSTLRGVLDDKRFFPTVSKDGLKPIFNNDTTNIASRSSEDGIDKCHDDGVTALLNAKDIPSDDDTRVARRRYLNKLAAQRCREKKKTEAEDLKMETEKLECKNTELKHSVRKLLRQKDELLFLLTTHAQKFHPNEDILKGAVNDDILGWNDGQI